MGRQNVLEHLLLGTHAFSKLEFSESLGSTRERSAMKGEHWSWILQTLIKRAKKKSEANYACFIIMFLLSLLKHYNIEFNEYDPNGGFFSQPSLI